MNARRTFRMASLGLVGLLAGGNILPNSCVNKKVVVAPVYVEKPVSSLGEQVERLNGINSGYALTERDLVALTRMLYFEDAGDRLLHGDAEQKKGYAAVAEVIKNRFLFDTCAENAPVRNPTCGGSNVDTMYDGDQGLGAIIEQHIVKNGKRIYQFTSQADFSQYFQPASLDKGMNYLIPKKVDGKIVKDKNGKTVYVSVFDEKQIALAYSALAGVLDGNIPAITEGALSYKNSDTTNQVWNDEQVFLVPSEGCSGLRISIGPKGRDAVKNGRARCRVEQAYVHDNTGQIGSHDFYTVVEGERREIVWDDKSGNTYVNGTCTKGPCK
ncbi:MAG: hypothetical protein Q8R18_00240 [bacterium]|nr:hypothetical protein [bacterium]